MFGFVNKKIKIFFCPVYKEILSLLFDFGLVWILLFLEKQT